MNVLDVNVLLALFRGDHPKHEACQRWWDTAAAVGQPITVPDIVWVGFLRLATHRAVAAEPASFAQAWAFVEAVCQQGTYLTYTGDTRLLGTLATICQESGARADLVTDAYIAAVATVYGASVVTLDRDFRKFDGIRVVEPA